MSDCKGCNGFNAGLGDYCPACLTAARQIERKADKEMLRFTGLDRVKVTLEPKVALEVQTQQIIDKLDGILRHTI